MFLWKPGEEKKPIARMTGHQQLVNQVILYDNYVTDIIVSLYDNYIDIRYMFTSARHSAEHFLYNHLFLMPT